MIHVKDLRFGYGTEPVLRGIDLEIDSGEVVALTGRSGSGKSTLLNCVAGLLTGWTGEVTVLDHMIQGMGDKELSTLRRNNFGYVLQFGRLVPELTALENVALPLRLVGRSRVEAEQRALEVMDQMEVGELGGQSSGTLSGGQQQRIAVARALVHNPRVVFADEPTGALDSVNSASVLRCLLDQARGLGATVLMVTHERGIARQADRIVDLQDGTIAGRTPCLTR